MIHSFIKVCRRDPKHILPLQSIKQIAAPDLTLPATARQRACAVDKTCTIHAQHAHLSHSSNERKVPRTLTDGEGAEWDRGNRILRNALVRWEGERCSAVLCLRVVLVIPGTDG